MRIPLITQRLFRFSSTFPQNNNKRNVRILTWKHLDELQEQEQECKSYHYQSISMFFLYVIYIRVVYSYFLLPFRFYSFLNYLVEIKPNLPVIQWLLIEWGVWMHPCWTDTNWRFDQWQPVKKKHSKVLWVIFSRKNILMSA